jgi:fructuronate reductase
MNTRLHPDMLQQLPISITPLSYVPNAHQCGILHFGIGAFHRAHQALFTHDVLSQVGGDWRIHGVSLRSARVSEQLTPQDGLYTLTEQDATGSDCKLIGAIAKVSVAATEQETVLTAFTDPKIHIVTMTVTEKGYCYHSQQKTVDADHVDIVHDIANPKQPISLPGYLVAGLQRRRDSINTPMTMISCDNMPHNGQILKQVVTSLAHKWDPQLAQWITDNVTFCSSMVDRIVPAVTQEVQAEHAQRHGIIDAGLIMTEPFKQWVIEDNFCTPRPQWESVGVDIVTDVSVYENIKLRNLNASHSALAYHGLYKGYQWIHEAINDPELLSLVTALMQTEIQDTLVLPDNFALHQYQAAIVSRFQNNLIPYATNQVATDGSLKLQQRIVPPLIERLRKGQSSPVLTGVLVAWIQCIKGEDQHGSPIKMQDPQINAIQAMVLANIDSPQTLLQNLVAEFGILPEEIMQYPTFVELFIEMSSGV